MKCIACGREMIDMKTYYQCSNVLCDCEEEIEDRDVYMSLKSDMPSAMVVNNAVRSVPLTC
jgi:hypothetical protein